MSKSKLQPYTRNTWLIPLNFYVYFIMLIKSSPKWRYFALGKGKENTYPAIKHLESRYVTSHPGGSENSEPSPRDLKLSKHSLAHRFRLFTLSLTQTSETGCRWYVRWYVIWSNPKVLVPQNWLRSGIRLYHSALPQSRLERLLKSSKVEVWGPSTVLRVLAN